jgi:hypothetical protein
MEKLTVCLLGIVNCSKTSGTLLHKKILGSWDHITWKSQYGACKKRNCIDCYLAYIFKCIDNMSCSKFIKSLWTPHSTLDVTCLLIEPLSLKPNASWHGPVTGWSTLELGFPKLASWIIGVFWRPKMGLITPRTCARRHRGLLKASHETVTYTRTETLRLTTPQRWRFESMFSCRHHHK